VFQSLEYCPNWDVHSSWKHLFLFAQKRLSLCQPFQQARRGRFLIYLIPLFMLLTYKVGPDQGKREQMNYATVMVCLGLEQSNDVRLEIAGQLAERFGAYVIGVAAGEFVPPLYFTTGAQAERVLDEGKAAIKTRINELEAQFRAAMQNRATAVEWRCAEDFSTRFMIQQARAADIIVIGDDGHDVLADPFVKANPSDLVMQAGRPLLVVPGSCNWLDLRSVVIAWKDTHEARRAVVDALPMLRQAKDVNVVEIVEEDGVRPASLSRVKDVVAWLSRHGVVASGQVPDECGNAAAQIDKIASRVEAGLVVAGAYGHSRFREWVLGGVTRSLVNPSGRCSLLSR
jgi:nucleotide-binding universal stress UspA family protein